jgi:hypothetical protein
MIWDALSCTYFLCWLAAQASCPSPYQFHCTVNKGCVLYKQRCDYSDDCGDGSDEDPSTCSKLKDMYINKTWIQELISDYLVIANKCLTFLKNRILSHVKFSFLKYIFLRTLKSFLLH